MEVMSSVLLFALVALLPQGLGKQTVNTGSQQNVKFNNSLLIQQKYSSAHKLLLNLNAPPLVFKVNEVQEVFNDILCKKCLECMERAIKAYKVNSKLIGNQPHVDYLHDEILTNTIHTYKVKRDVTSSNKTEIEEKKEKRPRKKDSKKNKVHKAVTVTKYNIDGTVFALKVKETNISLLNDNNPSTKPSGTTCQLYNIKKSFPCDSPEGDLMLKLAKRKTSKKVKKDKEKQRDTSTMTKKASVVYRKREVDDSQLPENVMSSIEEFY